MATKQLSALAMDKIRHEASPIFGRPLEKHHARTGLSAWMSSYPDDTKLVHMNIPGAHDAATWNYTRQTQDALKNVTELAKLEVPHPNGFAARRKA